MNKIEENAKKLSELLKVLSNQHRLLILCNLIEKDHTVSDLGKKLPRITQSALSQHLAILKAHGILDSEKEGQTVTYSLADDRIKAVMRILKEKYC